MNERHVPESWEGDQPVFEIVDEDRVDEPDVQTPNEET